MPLKKGKGKLPLFCGNGERVNPIYAPLAMYPTPICRKPYFPQRRLHLSDRLRADAIRRRWRGCHILKPHFTVQTSNTHLPRGDAFHAYKAIEKK